MLCTRKKVVLALWGKGWSAWGKRVAGMAHESAELCQCCGDWGKVSLCELRLYNASLCSWPNAVGSRRPRGM